MRAETLVVITLPLSIRHFPGVDIEQTGHDTGYV